MILVPVLIPFVSAVAKPHIVVVLADGKLVTRSKCAHLTPLPADFGHYNVGYHGNTEVKTPEIDALASKGVKLSRHYTYKICSPSRSSFQSGRLPVNVNTENASPENVNPKDPVSGFAGIAPNMTCIGNKLKAGAVTKHGHNTP